LGPLLLKALMVYLFFAITWRFFRAVFHVVFVVLVIAVGLWAWRHYGAQVLHAISGFIASASTPSALSPPPLPHP
jgi:hypothetical protein